MPRSRVGWCKAKRFIGESEMFDLAEDNGLSVEDEGGFASSMHAFRTLALRPSELPA